MKTLFDPSFSRNLRKIKDEALRERVMAVIAEIDAAKTLGDISNMEKLKGHSHAYRIRVGDYRIACYCKADQIELIHFLHRKDIYKKFP